MLFRSMTVVHRRGKDNIVPDALSRSICAVSANNAPLSSYDKLLQKIQNEPELCSGYRFEDGQLWKFVPVEDEPFDARFEWKMVPHLKIDTE